MIIIALPTHKASGEPRQHPTGERGAGENGGWVTEGTVESGPGEPAASWNLRYIPLCEGL